jgi:hypothetical protein
LDAKKKGLAETLRTQRGMTQRRRCSHFVRPKPGRRRRRDAKNAEVGRKRKAEVEDLKLEVSGFICALKKALHYLPLFGKKKLIDARSMNLLFSREGD